MGENKLTSIELVYSRANGHVSVYRAWDEVRKKRVCIKEQRCVTIREFNRRLQEGMNQSSLVHPGICKLYECYLKQDRTQLFYVIEMELMERDLNKEIHTRSEEFRPWTEREFKQIIFVLVDALAYAQEHEICHRDISPQNIFVSHNGIVKLGDFGSSSRNVDEEDEVTGTSTGNPLYQSPTFKFAPGVAKSPFYNSYKNDVYSLGATLLAMAHLKEMNDLCELKDLESYIRESISCIPYAEDIKTLIRQMMEINEEVRGDFVELRRNMMSLFQIKEPNLNTGILNKCLFCHIRILPSEIQHQVQLACDPGHVFCGNSCFRQFIERNAISGNVSMDFYTCPKKKCRKVIDSKLIASAFIDEQSFKHRKIPSDVHSCGIQTVTSELVESTKHVVAKNCCYCLAPVTMCAIEATFRQLASDVSISLPCDELSHIFCTPECLRDYVKVETQGYRRKVDVVSCPICAHQIPSELIFKAFGGRGKFLREVESTQIKWASCKLCKLNKMDLMLPCGHCFCKMCVKMEFEMLRMQGYKSLKCMVCHRSIYEESSLNDLCRLV